MQSADKRCLAARETNNTLAQQGAFWDRSWEAAE